MRDTRTLLERFKINKDYNLISMPEVTLTPQEADTFIEMAWDQSVMKNYARIEKMTQPQKFVRQIGYGTGDFLYPAEEFNESKYKKEWVQNRIQLSTQEARGAFPIFDADVEDIAHIETEAEFKSKLMSMVAKKMANQLEDVAYMSDTHGLNSYCADNLRSKFDGWRYIINHSQSGQQYENNVTGSAHIKEACLCQSGDSCPSGQADPDADFKYPGKIAEYDPNEPWKWEFKYHKMIKNMPAKYKQEFGLQNFAFLNSDLVTQDYIEALMDRGTEMGDKAIKGEASAMFGKVPIVDVPLMPTDLGQDADGTYGLVDGGAYTDAIMTYKGNLIIGIQRDIKIETWRYPPDQATYFFYSVRLAYGILNVNAIVFVRCLTHEC